MLRGSEELGIYGDGKNSNKYPLYGLAGRVSVDPRCIIYWGNYGTGSLRIVLVSTNRNVSLGVDSGNRLSQLKPEALKEAMQLCRGQAKQMKIVKEDAIPMSVGVFAQYHLTFRCE